MAFAEISAERRGLHQRLASDLWQVGIRRVTEQFERQGIVAVVKEQTADHFRQKRIQRRLAAAASR